jgi:hypothetical protein
VGPVKNYRALLICAAGLSFGAVGGPSVRSAGGLLRSRQIARPLWQGQVTGGLSSFW